jgi:hypothetical protein
MFQSYLGTAQTSRPGAQHMLNAEYFRRIDALNFTMMHDDGQQTENLEQADVLLLGVSRTSKTPTSIYLANRGVKTANIPLVPGVALPPFVENLKHPLIVGLIASPERIVQIRQNRLLSLNADQESPYVDRMAVAAEIAHSKRLFAERGWPMIDVTRRSIEETAAGIIDLYKEHRLKFIAEGESWARSGSSISRSCSHRPAPRGCICCGRRRFRSKQDRRTSMSARSRRAFGIAT